MFALFLAGKQEKEACYQHVAPVNRKVWCWNPIMPAVQDITVLFVGLPRQMCDGEQGDNLRSRSKSEAIHGIQQSIA